MSSDTTAIDTMVFLGAGASAADGAPMQTHLFREFFKHCRPKGPYCATHEWDRVLATFFSQFFGIDVDNDDLDRVAFPTFEEILGILEIADSQGESFRELPGPHLIGNGTSQVWHIHDLLVFSIAEILHEKLNNGCPTHEILIRSLESAGRLARTAFASFNYDILIDNSLLSAVGEKRVDYGVAFVNQNRRPGSNAVSLYKLHGSLNWLSCPTCRNVQITPWQKGVMKLKWEPHEVLCERCKMLRSPVVIPPTFFKALSNLHLMQIWDAAERACLRANRLIFCGYSFPDADIHVRYLLKRVERLRESTPEMFVVNHHVGKSAEAARDEAARYRRFVSNKGAIHFTDVSFEEFARDPTVIEDSGRWR
jgi:hypothetical protein